MTNSILHKWLLAIDATYVDYFVTGRHPTVRFISSSISYILWAAIIIAFFSLLYFHHYLIWAAIVALLAIIEFIYQIAK